MNSITALSTTTSAVPVPKPPDTNSVSSVSSKASISRSQSTDISILTDEGDKVTLSADFTAQAEFATYDSRGNDGRHSERSASLKVERSFSFTVEGDLNPEELKDIRKAIRTIEKATHDVLSGNPEKAAQRVSKLDRLDTIAELHADVEITNKVSLETTAGAAAKPVEEVPQPSPAVEVPTDSGAQNVTEAPATETAPAPVTPQPPPAPRAAWSTPFHLLQQSQSSLSIFFAMIAKLQPAQVQPATQLPPPPDNGDAVAASA